MISWQEFTVAAPQLAQFGAERFKVGVAYLATLRPDGSPRVHPVTPIIAAGRLFVFTYNTSPKGNDLRRDGRYALHSLVTDSQGSAGEFVISGLAHYTDKLEDRQLAAAAASYSVKDNMILFEFSLSSALSQIYQDGEPIRQRWQA